MTLTRPIAEGCADFVFDVCSWLLKLEPKPLTEREREDLITSCDQILSRWIRLPAWVRDVERFETLEDLRAFLDSLPAALWARLPWWIRHADELAKWSRLVTTASRLGWRRRPGAKVGEGSALSAFGGTDPDPTPREEIGARALSALLSVLRDVGAAAFGLFSDTAAFVQSCRPEPAAA